MQPRQRSALLAQLAARTAGYPAGRYSNRVPFGPQLRAPPAPR